jgi:hypothetical protein
MQEDHATTTLIHILGIRSMHENPFRNMAIDAEQWYTRLMGSNFFFW